MVTLILFLCVMIACFFSGFMATISGFGQAIVFQMVWILSSFIIDGAGELRTALAVMVCMTSSIAIVLGVKGWRDSTVVWTLVIVMLPFNNLFYFFGTYLAVTVDEALIRLILGILFLIFSMSMLIYQSISLTRNKQIESTPNCTVTLPCGTNQSIISWLKRTESWGGMLAGGAGGLLGGIFGTGGAPVMILFSAIDISKSQMRSTAQINNMVAIPFKLTSAIVFGLFQYEEWPLYVGCPFMCLLGIYVGSFVFHYVDEKFTRNILFFLIALSSISMTTPSPSDGAIGKILIVAYIICLIMFIYLFNMWRKRMRKAKFEKLQESV